MLFFNFLWLFYLMVLINGYTISKSDGNEDTTRDYVDRLRDEECGGEVPRRHRVLRLPRAPHFLTTAASPKLQNLAFQRRFHSTGHNTRHRRKRSRLRFEAQTAPSYDVGANQMSNRVKRKWEVSTSIGDLLKYPKDFFSKAMNKMTSSSTSSDLTTKADELHEITEAESQSTTPSPSTTRRTHHTTTTKSSPQPVNTVQLESLLEDIKAHALKILAHQNPTMASHIISSADEINYETASSIANQGDQVATHTTPQPRTLTQSETTIGAEISHNIMRRSTTEEIAQTIEDCLQKELKSVYYKLKSKVCQHVKGTEKSKPHVNSSCSPVPSSETPCPEKPNPCPENHTTPKSCPEKPTTPKPCPEKPTKPKSCPEKPTTPNPCPEIPCPLVPKPILDELKNTEVSTTKNTNPAESSKNTLKKTNKPKKTHKKHKLFSKLTTVSAVSTQANYDTKSNVTTTNTQAAKSRDSLKLPKENVKILSTDSNFTSSVKQTKENSSMDKQKHRVVKASLRESVHAESFTVAAASVDDLALLGLLEQMLVKSHEDGVRQVTSTYIPTYLPYQPQERLSKRNIETLSDLKLKEQVQAEEDYYPFKMTGTESTTMNDNTETFNYESISDKLSYKDFVDGYKYYLKYQKAMDSEDEKFSPMVRYQAHKHHKVDDIGKYILGRLPQVRDSRNIFEDIDIDDQDVSTKSEESWFRKHFYLFVDSTPRKFHTSETVTLKPRQMYSAVTAAPLDQPEYLAPGPHTSLPHSLDQLSQHLQRYKNVISKSSISPEASIVKEIEQKSEEPAQNDFLVKMIDILLGGKGSHSPKKKGKQNHYDPVEPHEKPNDIQIEESLRTKRAAQKTRAKTILKSTTPMTPDKNHTKGHRDKPNNQELVQMVAQPTAVVKPDNKTEPKLKSFMKRLFRKKGKRNKKTKRKDHRRRRFVPFKRLKDIILGAKQSSDNHLVTDYQPNVSDYDLMTTEIDTFDPLKYNRMPKVEDLQKEIATISDDYLNLDNDFSSVKPKQKTHLEANSNEYVTSKPNDKDLLNNTPESIDILDDTKIDEIGSNINKNLNNNLRKMTMSQLENYLTDNLKSVKGFQDPVQDVTFSKSPNNDDEKFILEPESNLEKKIKDDVKMTITTPVFNKISKTTATAVPEPQTKPKSLNIVRDEVDKLRDKLTLYDNLSRKNALTQGKKYNKVPKTFTKLEFGQASAQKRVNETGANNIFKNKKVVVMYRMNDVGEKAKLTACNDVTMKKKVARSALFRKNPKLDYENTINNPDTTRSGKNHRKIPSVKGSSVLTTDNKGRISQYAAGTDHYRDLLLWHGDILNADSVSTNNNFDNNLELLNYTPPNVEKLANEALNMKKYIQSLVSKAPIDHFSNPKLKSREDDFVLIENEIDKMYQRNRVKDDQAYSLIHPITERYLLEDILTTREAEAEKRLSSHFKWTNLQPMPNVMYTRPAGTRNKERDCMKHPNKTRDAMKTQSRVNKAPAQSFATPLPMDSRQFQHFLKESHLDVDTVTAPVVDIEENKRSDKIHAPELPTMSTSLIQNNLTVTDSNRTTTLQNNDADDTNLPISPYTKLKKTNVTFVKKKIRHKQPKKKLKQRGLISRKKETSSSLIDLKHSEHNNAPEESFEFDGPTESPNDVTMIAMPKPKNLLYFYVVSNSTEKSYPATVSMKKLFPPFTITSPLPTNLGHSMVLMKHQPPDNVMKNLGIEPRDPKRVRISYHYDIFYDNRPKNGKLHGLANTDNNKAKYRLAAVQDTKNKSDNTTKVFSSEEVATDVAALVDVSNKYAGMKRNSVRKTGSKFSNGKLRLRQKRVANESNSTQVAPLAKRNLNPFTYTAQNVGAFEVYLDVTTTTEGYNNFRPEKNSLQVHIAMSPEQNVKRQLNPALPIFSAKMSDPVNLEYRVPAITEDNAIVPVTDSSSYLSPGLYMVVDNYLQSGKVSLKPVLSDLHMMNTRRATTRDTPKSTTTKCATTNNVKDLKKVTLNKDFIEAINKHLIQLYENYTAVHNAKRNINSSVGITEMETGEGVTKRGRRNIRSWPSFKETFLGERTCDFHFKPNQTLCPACVATDTIIDELTFEFNNLANFMKDHCTEIQTFFWMNPSGGKRLSESVHKVDRLLTDYYRRVAKCQGKTCHALSGSSCPVKREIDRDVPLRLEDVHAVVNDLANVFKCGVPYNERLKRNTKYFLNVVDDCLPGVRHQTSGAKQRRRSRSLHTFKKVTDNKNIKRRRNISLQGLKTSPWYDKFYESSTYHPGSEGTSILTMDPTLNALTHNLNELFILFNNLKETDPQPLLHLKNKLHSKQKSDITVSTEKEVKRKFRKRKRKFNLFGRRKYKTTTEKPTDIKTSHKVSPALNALATSETTRALRVILSNVKEKPTLYVTVDSMMTPNLALPEVAYPAHFSPEPTQTTSPSPPPLLNLKQTAPAIETIKVPCHTTKLASGECIIFEEGCEDKHNFMHRLQKLFGGVIKNNAADMPARGCSRSARKVKIRQGDAMPYDLIIVTKHPLILKYAKSSAVAGLRFSTPKITQANTETTTQSITTTTGSQSTTLTPYNLIESKNSERTTQAGFKNKVETTTSLPNTSTINTDPIYVSEKLLSDIEALGKYTVYSDNKDGAKDVGDVATVETDTSLPTIIIIDEGMKEGVVGMTSQDNVTTPGPYDPKELLLSIISFEQNQLNDELNKVRKDRGCKLKIKCKTPKPKINFNSDQHFLVTPKYDIFRDIKNVKKKVKCKIGKVTCMLGGCNACNYMNTTSPSKSRASRQATPQTDGVTPKYDFFYAIDQARKKVSDKYAQMSKAMYSSASNTKSDSVNLQRSLMQNVILTEKPDYYQPDDILKFATKKNRECTDEPELELETEEIETSEYTERTEELKTAENTEIPEERETSEITESLEEAETESTEKPNCTKRKCTKCHQQDPPVDIVAKIKELAKFKHLKFTTCNTPTTCKNEGLKIVIVTTPKPPKPKGKQKQKGKNKCTKHTCHVTTTTTTLPTTTTLTTSRPNELKLTKYRKPVDYRDSETGEELSMEDPESEGYEIDDPDVQDTEADGITIKDRGETTIFMAMQSPTRKTHHSGRAHKARHRGHKTTSSVAPKVTRKKASDVRRAHLVCDLSATVDHYLKLRRSLPLQDFQQYVRNLTCYQHKETPRYIVINSKNPEDNNRLKLEWSWARDVKDGVDHDKSLDKANVDDVLVNFMFDEDFEKFYKGEHGIYRMEDSKRKRRTVDTMDLNKELTNLPPLRSAPNEILALSGAQVLLRCGEDSLRDDLNTEEVKWVSLPDDLVRKPNVRVEGDKLRIQNVRRSNAGSYVCKEGDRIRSTVQVTVTALPSYHIALTPMYSIQNGQCTIQDLRAIRSLGGAMSRLACPGGHCEVKVRGTDCLKDERDGSSLLRGSASLAVGAPRAACGAGCERDLVAQLVRLAVEDVPKMFTVDVILSGTENKTLVPVVRDGPFAVTHKLRRRGTVSPSAPGHVAVTVRCRRGYRLLSRLKICVADAPADGKTRRQKNFGSRTRRYDWWWAPACGYTAAVSSAALACGACALCAALGHFARKPAHGEASPPPASHSRVVLARIFKRSLDASVTDSADSRSVRPKRPPPPLPPVDFD